MQDDDLILKECLRCVRVEIADLPQESGLTQKRLSLKQLRNKRIAFIEHCNAFHCFYVDMNG